MERRREGTGRGSDESGMTNIESVPRGDEG